MQQDIQQHITALTEAIHVLIKSYMKSEELISNQISSVVKSDVAGLTEFSEQQTQVNMELEEYEIRFRTELETIFLKVAPSVQPRKLTTLIPHLNGNVREMEQLRDKLIDHITSAKNKQAQLLNLLEFAQQHTTDTLRAIHAMSNNTSKRYTMNGKAATEQRSIAINQTA